MKKKNILVLIFTILVILGFITLTLLLIKGNSKPNKKQNEKQEYSAQIYYELEDRNIYFHGLNSIKFTYNNETKELKEWFKKDRNFLNKFLNSLEYEATMLDGGSKIYNHNDNKVIVCHTLDKNYNIHIVKDLITSKDVCKIPMKNDIIKNRELFLNNLIEEVGFYISSDTTMPKELYIKDLIDVDMNEILYEKVMQNDRAIYAIIKTDNDNIVKELDKYFEDNYKGYKKVGIKNYYAYVYNNKIDFSLDSYILQGKVLKVSTNEILVESGSEKYRVHHNMTYDFKVNDIVNILYNGNVEYSNPAQIGALYVEVEKEE